MKISRPDFELKDAQELRSGYTRVDSVVPESHPAVEGTQTRYEVRAPEKLPALVERRATWAVIVNHGMGQQVHFETLELVVLALLNAQLRAVGQAAVVNTRIVKLHSPGPGAKDVELLRAEMEVTCADRRTRSVDVYESYWAPLTEGKVSLWDCIKFLLEGAWGGFWYLLPGKKFVRWVFGGMKEFHIHELLTAIKLVVGLFVLFAPVLLASVVTSAQVGGALLGMLGGGFGAYAPGGKFEGVMRAFTPDMAWFDIFIFLYFVSVTVLPMFYRKRFFVNRAGIPGAVRVSLQRAAVAISGASLASLFFVELRFLYRAWKVYMPQCITASLARVLSVPGALLTPGLRAISHHLFWQFPIGRERLVAVWFFALVAALMSRWFLIEYMGDVAA